LRTTLSSARARLASDATVSSSRAVSTTPVPGPLVFLLLALCSRKLRRSDASEGSVVPPPEGLSANTRLSCRGPVFLNPSLPLLHRLSPASALLRRDPTSAWASAGRRCLLPAYRLGYQAHARRGDPHGPMQTSQGKDTGCTAAPVPNTAPTSVGFWASRSLARSPDRPGLLRASLSFAAAARLGLPPHTASQHVQLPSACGCYQLAPQRTCTSYPGSMPGTPSPAQVRAAERLRGIDSAGATEHRAAMPSMQPHHPHQIRQTEEELD
jgi:hypothetical protein